jgi:hypothetical protein
VHEKRRNEKRNGRKKVSEKLNCDVSLESLMISTVFFSLTFFFFKEQEEEEEKVRRKGKKNRECRSNQKSKKHPVKNVTFLIITSFFQNSFYHFPGKRKYWEKEGKRSELKDMIGILVTPFL